MEDINWKESVGRRFLTRVTETTPSFKDSVVVYLREIEIIASTNDGEQVQMRFPHNAQEHEWADTMTNTLRVGLRSGGVQTHEIIGDATRKPEE